MDCFSRLANCLESLQGVRPAMSAEAGGGEGREEERRSEERARKISFPYEKIDYLFLFGFFTLFILSVFLL